MPKSVDFTVENKIFYTENLVTSRHDIFVFGLIFKSSKFKN